MLAPDVDIIIDTEDEDIQTSYTYRLDLENGRITGNIDNIEALHQTIFKILSTERFQFLIYDINYGIEKQEIQGGNYTQDFIKSELKRMVTEALLEDDRILEVKDFAFKFEGDECHVEFVVDSVFGNFIERTVI